VSVEIARLLRPIGTGIQLGSTAGIPHGNRLILVCFQGAIEVAICPHWLSIVDPRIAPACGSQKLHHDKHECSVERVADRIRLTRLHVKGVCDGELRWRMGFMQFLFTQSCVIEPRIDFGAMREDCRLAIAVFSDGLTSTWSGIATNGDDKNTMRVRWQPDIEEAQLLLFLSKVNSREKLGESHSQVRHKSYVRGARSCDTAVPDPSNQHLPIRNGQSVLLSHAEGEREAVYDYPHKHEWKSLEDLSVGSRLASGASFIAQPRLGDPADKRESTNRPCELQEICHFSGGIRLSSCEVKIWRNPSAEGGKCTTVIWVMNVSVRGFRPLFLHAALTNLNCNYGDSVFCNPLINIL